MPVEIVLISPAPNGQIANGDVSSLMASGGLEIFVDGLNFLVGKDPGSGKIPITIHFAMFLRFEIQVPPGSTINSLRLNLWSNGVTLRTMTKMKGGFVRPQTGDFNWEHADGVARWRDTSDMPFGETQRPNLPNAIHDEVWWDGAPAFQNQPMTRQGTNRASWSIGDGLAGFNDVTGLAAQLQSYLADATNELLRGTGNDLGGLPVCFHLLHSTDGVGLGGLQGGIFSDNVDEAAFVPTLEIDWTEANIRTEARTLTRPPDSATLTRPATEAKLTRPVDRAELQRPATRTTLKRPPTRATLKRPQDRGTLKTE